MYQRSQAVEIGFITTILIVSVGGVVFSLIAGISFIFYMFISVLSGSTLFVIYKLDSNAAYPRVSKLTVKVLDIVVYATIILLVVLSRTEPGVQDLFYYALFSYVIILLIRIASSPDLRIVPQILLSSLALQQGLWNSAPVVSKDPRLHVGLTEFIVSTGYIISSPSQYYRDFPVTHVLGAQVNLILSVPIRQAFFIAVAVPAVLGMIAILLTTYRISPWKSWGPSLLAILFLSIHPAEVLRIGYPVAQTLELALIAVILLIVASPIDKRRQALGIVFIGVLIFTHNISVMTVAIILGTISLFYLAYSRGAKPQVSQKVKFQTAIVFLACVAGLEYWNLVGYFRFQVARVISIIGGSSSVAGEAATASFGGESFSLNDPVLQLGFGLLLTATLVGCIALWVLNKHLNGEKSPAVSVWAPAAVVLFGLLGISTVTGGVGKATRLTAAVLLVIAPSIGIILYQLGRKRIGRFAVCILLLSPVGLALVAAENDQRNRLTPPTNRPLDDFPNHLSASEVAAVDFATDSSSNVRAIGYVATWSAFSSLADDQPLIVDEVGQTELNSSWLTDCGVTIYRDRYIHFLQVKAPPTQATIYSSGDAHLLWC